VELLVTVGENAEFIAKEAKQRGLHNVVSFRSNAEVIRFLKENLTEGDVVLVKGSRGMRTDEIVAAFIG